MGNEIKHDTDAVKFQNALDQMLGTYFDGRDRRRTTTRLTTTLESGIQTTTVELLVDNAPIISCQFRAGKFSLEWENSGDVDEGLVSDYDDVTSMRDAIAADLLESIRDSLHEF